MIRKITVWYDGACEPINPGGHAGYGFVIKEEEKILYSFSGYLSPGHNTSNNVAEYMGLISALEWLLRNGHGKDQVRFFGDNMMTVNQMNGRWKARKGIYIPFYRLAKGLGKRFKDLFFTWIPREENGEADELSKAELVKRKVRFKIQPQEAATN